MRRTASLTYNVSREADISLTCPGGTDCLHWNDDYRPSDGQAEQGSGATRGHSISVLT